MTTSAATYVPELLDNGESGYEYVRVLVPVLRCATCNCQVVRPERDSFRSPFVEDRAALEHPVGLKAQLQRAGIKLVGGYRDDDPVCAACWTSGKVKHECQLCRCMVPSDQIQESVQDDHLCVECYRTLPAKTWCEKLTELYEDHRYDNC